MTATASASAGTDAAARRPHPTVAAEAGTATTTTTDAKKPSEAKTVDQETLLRMEIEASKAEKRNPENKLDQLNLGWAAETAAVFKRARERIKNVSGSSFNPMQSALETAKERRRTAAVDAMGKLEERKNARGKLRRNRKDRDDWDDDGRRTYGKLGGMGGIDRYGKNKGVDARTDKDKRGMRDQSNEGVMEALERKAAQYEKLSRGEYDEKDADKYDVDFHRKGAMGAGWGPDGGAGGGGEEADDGTEHRVRLRRRGHAGLERRRPSAADAGVRSREGGAAAADDDGDATPGAHAARDDAAAAARDDATAVGPSAAATAALSFND